MRFDKVLLVNPVYDAGHYSWPLNPPASLGYLGSFLSSKGCDGDVFDMALHPRFSHLESRIIAYRPDLIGLTVFSYRYAQTYRLIRAIKERFPRVSIVVGGPHPSLMKETILRECPAIDFAVVSDGEETLWDLISGKELPDIPGLAYRKDGQPHWNGPRTLPPDLDRYPFPTYEKFELGRYLERRIPIITSRGCPFSCIYCAAPKICGKRVRFRTPQHVVEEIRYWYHRGYRDFPLMDDNFIIWKGRALEICDLIRREGFSDASFSCPAGIRADCVDEEILDAMRTAGFREIAIGVEVGNDRMLKLIRKNETFDRIDNAVRLACEKGFVVTLFFLVGSPGETWQDFMDGIRFALKYPVKTAKWFNLIPFPGTELYEHLEAEDRFTVPPSTYLNHYTAIDAIPLFTTDSMPLPLRRKALRLGRKTEAKVIKRFFLHKYRQNPWKRTFLALLPVGFLFRIYRSWPFLRKLVQPFLAGPTHAPKPDRKRR